MFKILYIFFFAIVVSNCSFKKVVKHHGVPFLDKKQKQLIIDQSTSNDIRKILGSPSTQSKFDNNIWIYIERKKANRSVFKLGTQKIENNNIVIIEIDKRGLVVKKEFLDINDMNEYKFTEKNTTTSYDKNSYISGVIKSLKQKIDAPVKRKKTK